MLYEFSADRKYELIEKLQKHMLRMLKWYNISPVFFSCNEEQDVLLYVLEFGSEDDKVSPRNTFVEDPKREQ